MSEGKRDMEPGSSRDWGGEAGGRRKLISHSAALHFLVCFYSEGQFPPVPQ